MNKTIVFGIILAIMSGLSCLWYEKLVKNYSYFIMLFTGFIYYVIVLVGFIIYKPSNLNEITMLFSNKSDTITFLLYMLTFIISPIWFFITKDTNVETGIIYEIMYVPIIAIIGYYFYQKQIDPKFWIGASLMLIGVYIINKK